MSCPPKLPLKLVPAPCCGADEQADLADIPVGIGEVGFLADAALAREIGNAVNRNTVDANATLPNDVSNISACLKTNGACSVMIMRLQPAVADAAFLVAANNTRLPCTIDANELSRSVFCTLRPVTGRKGTALPAGGSFRATDRPGVNWSSCLVSPRERRGLASYSSATGKRRRISCGSVANNLVESTGPNRSGGASPTAGRANPAPYNRLGILSDRR